MKIALIGSGAWACGLANVASDNLNETIVYGIVPEEINDINNNHRNSKYLGDIHLNESIKATLDIKVALNNADVVVIAVPSVVIESVSKQIKDNLNTKPLIVNVTKGFEQKTHLTMIQYLKTLFNEDDVQGIVSLIGPSFALEVANKQYTAISAVSSNLENAQTIQKIFSNKYLRVYTNTDEIGCEYCSSLKNVMALASGILTGLGFEVNSHAALITRALVEIRRFVTTMGGREESCFGLAGVGDLVLTSTSEKSRNYSSGIRIAQIGIDAFLKENNRTVEGIDACKLAYNIAVKNNIYAPITTAVYKVLFEHANPIAEIKNMMSGELKEEK